MNEVNRGLRPPLAFRLLIDEAAKRTRRHFKAIYPMIAVPVAVLQAVIIVVQLRSMENWMRQLMNEDLAGYLSSMAGFFALTLVLWIGVGFASAAMFSAAVDAVAGRTVDLLSRVRYVLTGRVLITLLLAGLMIVCGLLACLIPGIFVALLLAFLIPIMIEEDRYFWEAIRGSVSLSFFNPGGQFLLYPVFRVFVLYVIIILISWAVALLFQLPVTVLQQFLMIREASELGPDPMAAMMPTRWLWLQVPTTIVSSLAQTAVQLYLFMGLALLYSDIRSRFDGDDLMRAIDGLVEARTQEHHKGTAP